MIDPAYYTPELRNLENFGKSFDELTELGAEDLFSFIKYDGRKRAYIHINHPDADSIGSSVHLAFLFQMKNVPYSIDSHNSSYKLTFSASRPPLSEIKSNLERDIKVLYVVTDCTPYSLFWEDVEKIYEQSKAKEYFHILVMDHHSFIGREEARGARSGEEKGLLTYINFGHSSNANVWWKRPNIPCAGEITFNIVSNILDKLNESSVDVLKHFLIPTLFATYTDFRTPQFLASIEDEKIRKVLENYNNVRTIKEYQGFVTCFEDFIDIFNGAIRYAGLKVGEEQRTYSLTENQKIHCPTHKLIKSAAANVMLASKIANPLVLTIYPKDLGYEDEDGYNLREILHANSEWGKIKSIARNAFFYYSFDHYMPKRDRVLYFNDTKSIIAILPKSQTKVYYKGSTIDLSKLLKYPPYIEYFFTGYYPIAESPQVKDSHLIIVGIESSKDDDYAEFSFRSHTPSVPAGHFASQIANRIRKELRCASHHVFGGGHEGAAGLRIRQETLDELKKNYDLENNYNLDIYTLINELVKNVRI